MMHLTKLICFVWICLSTFDSCSGNSVPKTVFKNVPVRTNSLDSNKVVVDKNVESSSNDKQKVGVLFLNLGGPKTLKVNYHLSYQFDCCLTGS